MEPISLFRLGKYSLDWVKDFYTQSDIWWGPDAGENYYKGRVATIEHICGKEPKRILELGAGSGAVAAILAEAGHAVVAVELTEAILPMRERNEARWKGSLTALHADFYTVILDGQFDVVCYWDGFGIGSDADQYRLLRRVAREWLAPAGSVLIDVFNPIRYARHASEEEILPPLKGVPGSVEMRHRCHFDPVQCRWIDEWEPTAEPDKVLAQTVRCYTPADFALLLKGSGLKLKSIEIDGVELDFNSNGITLSGPLMEAYSYLAQLIPDGR